MEGYSQGHDNVKHLVTIFHSFKLYNCGADGSVTANHEYTNGALPPSVNNKLIYPFISFLMSFIHIQNY